MPTEDEKLGIKLHILHRRQSQWWGGSGHGLDQDSKPYVSHLCLYSQLATLCLTADWTNDFLMDVTPEKVCCFVVQLHGSFND